MSTDGRPWIIQFQIQSEVDLDFVIGQGIGYPVGMVRNSPPEFRRRILAGAISYQLQLKSIDYALKRYVKPDTFEGDDLSLGDAVSGYLRNSVAVLMKELRNLHTEDPAFGTFGAEITLFRLPHSLDVARMLSNRGLLLEVLPILRLCLEMIAWSNSAFHMQDEGARCRVKGAVLHFRVEKYLSDCGEYIRLSLEIFSLGTRYSWSVS